MFLDNGLTLEQQERMDNIYESLMSDLKSVNIKLYQRLRANELSVKDVIKLANSKNSNIIIDDKEQYYLFEV
jgi:L-rhamnose mutarotase